MSDSNFADFITRERDRLSAERAEIFTQQQELEGKLTALNNEMRAIDAYETAKSGKAAAPTRRASTGRQTRRGSKREELIKIIAEGGGLSRGQILERMNLKGDKAGEMSVSNALTALTKGNQVRRENGKYLAA
ncbi:MAG TPA: hypothetical protein VHY35_06200 [Stellaceae bacterium]|jgi:hypothetical protein|nr:hypothetical protein [Stellaceae bacterium]